VTQCKIRDFEFEYSTRDLAFKLLSTNRNSQRVRVLEVFLSCQGEGATDAEVAEVLGVERTSVIARRHEIIKNNPDLFFVIGKRKNIVSGCFNDVWVVKGDISE